MILLDLKDFTAFSSDKDFDEIKWINSVLKDLQKNEKEVSRSPNHQKLKKNN